MQKYLTIEDLRVGASKVVPKMFFDYLESGSWAEDTLRSNLNDFKKIKFIPRVVKNISNRNLNVTVFDEHFSLPLGLAPCGLTGMQMANGELHSAKAAEKFGLPFTLSTMSIASIEDVAEYVDKPFWFQLYVMKNHDFAKKLMDRASAAGVKTLVLTVDLQILGQRHRDIKNGLSSPPKMTLRNIVDLAKHPFWCLRMLKAKRRTFGNIVGHTDSVSDNSSLAAWIDEQFDLDLSWDDLRKFRDYWKGNLVLKGIMDPQDALKACDIGADGIIVSNHGGRQLDGAISSICALPKITAAVGGKTKIMFDGGVRCGQDILKAKASGAELIFIGRAYSYGLALAGEAGVIHALDILKKELDYSMALCGHRDITEIDNRILHHD